MQNIRLGDAVIEYRVRQVTRYVVTRYHRTGPCGSSTQLGEFDSGQTAAWVGKQLSLSEEGAIFTDHTGGDPAPVGGPGFAGIQPPFTGTDIFRMPQN